jgi:adenylyl-sulfate kinase
MPINVYGLDSPRVWDTESAFLHLNSLGLAKTKRTAERRLRDWDFLPAPLDALAVLDEFGRPPAKASLQREIDEARRKRQLVLFAQLTELPGGRPCLYANDARGSHYWVPLDGQDIGPQLMAEALHQLQRHLDKRLVVFPHGQLVAQCRSLFPPPDIQLNLLPYAPMPETGQQAPSPHKAANSNVYQQPLTITRHARERLNGHRGKVVWVTGLSGSGKSTLANALEVRLHEMGYRTFILDGDNIRRGISRDLGFSDNDRAENIRRIAEIAKLMLDAGMIVMTAFISPFRSERQMARQLIGADDFVEIYMNTPLEVCEARDPKGLYRKARSGLLPNMSGLDSPYESPESPEIAIDSSRVSIDDAVHTVLNHLQDSLSR